MDVTNKSQRQVIEELERYPDHLNITVVRPPQLPTGLEDSLFRYFSRRFTEYDLVMTASTQLVNDHHLDQRQHIMQGCAHFLKHESAVVLQMRCIFLFYNAGQSKDYQSGKAKYAKTY